jgi:parallel beta-helix repeat protein
MRKLLFILTIGALLLSACTNSTTPIQPAEISPPSVTAPSIELDRAQVPIVIPITSSSLKYEEQWIVSDTVHIVDKSVLVSGDLIVKGALVLEDSTLYMEGLRGGVPKIEVVSGGRLEMHRSTVLSTSSERGYNFVFRPGSGGLLDGSAIEGVTANNEIFGTGEVHQHAGLGGLTILADDFTIRDSTIRNATGDTRGILIAEASNVLIEGNTISNNPRDGIRLANCSNITIRDNYILDNGTYGIKLMNCNNSIIEGNVFSGNCCVAESLHYGAIYLEFDTKDITVSKNEISNNKRDGIVIPGASRIKIYDNIIRGNGGYGIFVHHESNENEI